MTAADNNKVASEICADVKYVCKTFGSRNAGGEGERATAEYFAQRLSACANEVKTEQFKLYPNAFTGWITASVTCVMLGIVAYFFSSLVALLLFIVGLIPVVFEYILYKRMLDPLYKQETSANVTAVKTCSHETKRRLYFVANMDACFEDSVKYRLGGVMQVAIIAAGFLGVGYFIALSIARWAVVGGIGAGIASGATLYAGLAGLIFVIPLFICYFLKSDKNVVDGANGNLSGCFVAAKLLETIKDIETENTEIGVILTGGGAVGLRGAKVWCETHSEDTDKENTFFIVLNNLRELKSLNVNSVEMNGFVKNDKDVADLVLKAAEASGLKCANRCIPFGATDSAAFSQSGFKSAGIVAIDRKLPDYYQTRYDSYDNMSEECIAKCFELVLKIAEIYGDEPSLSALSAADDEIPSAEADVEAARVSPQTDGENAVDGEGQ